MKLFICVGTLQVSADSLCKQFVPKTSGLILAHKLFETLMLFLKHILKKSLFFFWGGGAICRQQNSIQNYLACKELMMKICIHNRESPDVLTGSICSNTDLSDLSIVGTCDIFVYQTCHKVM